MKLEIVICTHNRRELLARTLDSLDQAQRPRDCEVSILVVANASTDGTAALLDARAEPDSTGGRLPVRWVAENKVGKSHALNRAIAILDGAWIAFVDDDHRVDEKYLTAICAGIHAYSEASMLCGRILPDWDGGEPKWAHDMGPYRIYPLPVPRYEWGPEPFTIGTDGPLPGGGNLVVRRDVFELVSGFATELGPRGHDLGGGEDSEFVNRALASGVRLQYVPDIVQYHYVEKERFRLRYVLRKSFQRSRSITRVRAVAGKEVPRYLWRKLIGYLLSALVVFRWSGIRFYLVRIAATCGEISGYRSVNETGGREAGRARLWMLLAVLGGIVAVGVFASLWAPVWRALLVSIGLGLLGSTLLVVKSVMDFTRTGPQVHSKKIEKAYRGFGIYGVLRLGFWSAVLITGMSLVSDLVYVSLSALLDLRMYLGGYIGVGVAGVILISSFQFCVHLLFIPSSITASSQYRMSHFYGLWRHLTPRRLAFLRWLLVGGSAFLIASAMVSSGIQQSWYACVAFGGPGILIGLSILWAGGVPSVRPRRAVAPAGARPNILMIGCDTLRADRLGVSGYSRELTPFIDGLARKGAYFSNCYVPVPRTAPSLVSLMTGRWPQVHGIRDNFVGDEETELPGPALPELLRRAGYETAVISDWSGADYGKFRFGFERRDLPRDQWNLKYLIRQGPKDLRLFVSLFTHNRFGKMFLPELYYLAGVPLGRDMVRTARRWLNNLAQHRQPFLLNLFMATSHPPFGSEFPYYAAYSDSTYWGESKFAMARLTEPEEIIRSQREPREAFDLDQIIDLYDGSIRCFDDQVKMVVKHMEACGLADNTIVVVYSDHGMELFENDSWGQGNSVLTDHSPRIPLLVYDPRQTSTGTVDRVVRSVDLAPTLLELCGLPIPAEVDGVSLVPYFNQQALDMELPAYSETGLWLTPPPGMSDQHLRYPDIFDLLDVPDLVSGTLAVRDEYKRRIVKAKDRMVRRGHWKLVYFPMVNGASVRLFDVDDDPDCRRDVADEFPEVVGELQAQLCGWLRLDGIAQSWCPAQMDRVADTNPDADTQGGRLDVGVGN